MNRRSFIQILTAGIGSLFIPLPKPHIPIVGIVLIPSPYICLSDFTPRRIEITGLAQIKAKEAMQREEDEIIFKRILAMSIKA
jgi:hypothetical protein